MVWLYIFIIMLMRVVQSVFTKRASSSVPKNSEGFLWYTLYSKAVAAAFALILFLIDVFRGVPIEGFGLTLLYASLSGTALAITSLCSLYTLNNGSMVLNSLFGTAGLLIPAIAGIFMYNEILSVLQWIAIAVFMVGVYLLIGSSKAIFGKFSLKTLAVLILSLVMNGATMLFQKMFGMNVEGGNVSLFSLLSFASGAVLLAISLLVIFVYNRVKKAKSIGLTSEIQSTEAQSAELTGEMQSTKTEFPKRLYLFGLALAFAVFVINQLATLSTPLISAVVLFAIINGGATLISAIVGAIMYKEKLTVRSVIGLVLGIGALILIKI